MRSSNWFKIITGLILFVNSVTALNFINTPSVCAMTSTVPGTFRTLCHVKIDFSHYFARKFCKSYGMDLFDIKASPTSNVTVAEFVKKIYMQAPKANFYVKKRIGNRCLTYTGLGKEEFVWCRLPYNPICEFNIRKRISPISSKKSRIFQIENNKISAKEVSQKATQQSTNQTSPQSIQSIVSCRSFADKEYYYNYQPLVTRVCELNPITLPGVKILDASADSSKVFGVDISCGLDNCDNGSFLPVSLNEKFSNLEILSASSCKISSISSINFEGLTNLKYLDLSVNDIEYISEGTFQELTSLEFLSLGNNKLSTVTAGMLSGLAKIRELVLHENFIQSIRTGAFKDLESLEELDLEKNLLEFIDNEMFKGLTKLNYLYLQGNLINFITQNAFDDLGSLTYLDLGYNKLTIIQNGIFDNLSSLEVLILTANRLETVDREMLAKLGNLRKLILRENLIRMIPNGPLQDLTSLWELDLGNNLIELVTKDMFDGLQNLQNLFLGGNRISQIGSESFTDLSSLSILDLDNNVCVNSFFDQQLISELPLSLPSECIVD